MSLEKKNPGLLKSPDPMCLSRSPCIKASAPPTMIWQASTTEGKYHCLWQAPTAGSKAGTPMAFLHFGYRKWCHSLFPQAAAPSAAGKALLEVGCIQMVLQRQTCSGKGCRRGVPTRHWSLGHRPIGILPAESRPDSGAALGSARCHHEDHSAPQYCSKRCSWGVCPQTEVPAVTSTNDFCTTHLIDGSYIDAQRKL